MGDVIVDGRVYKEVFLSLVFLMKLLLSESNGTCCFLTHFYNTFFEKAPMFPVIRRKWCQKTYKIESRVRRRNLYWLKYSNSIVLSTSFVHVIFMRERRVRNCLAFFLVKIFKFYSKICFFLKNFSFFQ